MRFAVLAQSLVVYEMILLLLLLLLQSIYVCAHAFDLICDAIC